MTTKNLSRTQRSATKFYIATFAAALLGTFATAKSAHAQNGGAACPDVHQTILGTWSSGNLTETYSENGDYLLHNNNGDVRGHFTWTGPNTATLSAGTMENATYHFVMTGPNELVAINASNVATVYTRQGAGTALPERCLTVRRQIVGSWIAGNYHETYAADGAYTFNGHQGSYRFTAPGRADITIENQSGAYRFGMLADGRLVAISNANNRATFYTRER